MAQLWRHDDSGWVAVGLDTLGVEIALGPLVSGAVADAPAVAGAPHEGGSSSGAVPRGTPVLLRATVGSTEGLPGPTWVLAAPFGAGVAVNGEPAHAGLIALADRDEILLETGERMFFSLAAVAALEAFDAPPPGLRCPRCCRLFAASLPIVRCPGPGCGVIHHQTDELPCWTYTARCAVCPQSTALDQAPRWTPEGL